MTTKAQRRGGSRCERGRTKGVRQRRIHLPAARRCHESVSPLEFCEAHFAQVTENYLRYLRAGRLPDWEVPNMITKYATIMQAYKLCR